LPPVFLAPPDAPSLLHSFPTRRSSDLEVGGQRQARARTPQAPDDRAIFERRIAAFHRGQHAVRARLHGEMQMRDELVHVLECIEDRKSTRLNSSHEWISYAVFCLKKNK